MNNETIAIQAPAGGAISPLNGEFYKGGQFMCNQVGMPKGYGKKLACAANTRTAKTRNIAEVTVTQFRVLIRMAGEKNAFCVFSGNRAQNLEFAKLLLALKAARAEKDGIVPHPTELVIV